MTTAEFMDILKKEGVERPSHVMSVFGFSHFLYYSWINEPDKIIPYHYELSIKGYLKYIRCGFGTRNDIPLTTKQWLYYFCKEYKINSVSNLASELKISRQSLSRWMRDDTIPKWMIWACVEIISEKKASSLKR